MLYKAIVKFYLNIKEIMEEILNAITLKSVDVGENDKMITFFTLEKGVITVGAKGVKKDKAKLKFSAEPFCFCAIKVAEKSGRLTLVNADCKKSYFMLSSDISAYLCSCLLSETSVFLYKEQPDETLFKNLLKCYESYLKGVKKSVTVKFLLDSLSNAGYGYDFSACLGCNGEITGNVYLSQDASRFLCSSCAQENDIKFAYATYLRLNKINETDYFELSDDETDNNCLKLLAFSFKEKFNLTLKSVDMLLQF